MSINRISNKLASRVRDSVCLRLLFMHAGERLTVVQLFVMKLKGKGVVSPKEATSGQGPASESAVSHRVVQTGPVLALELSARATPAAAGGRLGFGLVTPAFQRICRRLGKYGIRRALGQGASGTVVLADDLKNGGKVAIKVMKRSKPGSKTVQHDLMNELAILRHLSRTPLRHSLVTEFRESFVDAYNYYIVMVCGLHLCMLSLSDDDW